ncbi:tripartite tricarboxylate transporter permease [Notoacmeibacter sp. MSK16QG-6]|uniref:tripartite tricarboxylate transporter permease n=1 Tax=Notoacmeibacter sp. MSK16QG-6 TaxID=2957982 RepID=UPI0020A00E01|nr:tripartite tricarboxylate transporter permease [Notoacmeibacter sp. MSK16QG-6]MCP1200560.1 tripartite tricarboxylate transporter permease [Notoacmeibacter sp. MSK16QG-6]
MYDLMLQGAAHVFQPWTLFAIFCGVTGGLVIGSIPGLTSTMAIALMVPLTYAMEIEFAIPLLMGVYCGAISGGLVGAILLNIPGTPASAGTCLDGYPMAAKGQATRALGLAVYSSMIGGVLSGLALVLIAPTLAKVALSFGPWEYFALVVFTFTCISAMSSKGRAVKAFMAAFIGLALALVGLDEASGQTRLTFGFTAFESGFYELPALIGLYAIPQLLADTDDIGRSATMIKINYKLREFMGTFREVMSRKRDLGRSTFLGIVIGILPGVGPGLSNIVAYSQAKRASSQPEKFGTGELPESVMSPEAANNASMGGALIPMLTLGIPGDASTLMMLGAFMLHGIDPGPLLFRDHGDIVWVVFIAFFVAFAFCTLVYHFFIPLTVKAISVPRQYVIPVLLILCTVGCYALNNRMFDVYCFLGFGLLGYFLHIARVPVLPVILGLILGPMAEEQLSLALAFGQGSVLPFVTRPISGTILLISILSLVLPPILGRRRRRKAVEPA